MKIKKIYIYILSKCTNKKFCFAKCAKGERKIREKNKKKNGKEEFSRIERGHSSPWIRAHHEPRTILPRLFPRLLPRNIRVKRQKVNDLKKILPFAV